MTDKEYLQKWSELNQRELQRSLIPQSEFNQKEFFDFQKEKFDLLMERKAEQELESKIQECTEKAVADIMKGLNCNINIKL